MARKSSEAGQKSEAKQNRREDVREECSAPRGKCAAKRRRVIWRKRGTNYMKNRQEGKYI